MTQSKLDAIKLTEAVAPTEVTPKWLTIANTCKAFGIGRTKLNELMNQRLVKFTRIKNKHQQRGRILIDVQSVQDLFNSWASEVVTPTAD